MSDALTILPETLDLAVDGWLDHAAIRLVRQHVTPPEMDAGQFALFMADARARGLDPMKRQIYAVARRTKNGVRITHQVGIDGFWTIAHRTGRVAGDDPPQWADADGRWLDVWLADTPPVAARVVVYRLDARDTPRPYHGIARWADYAVVEDEWVFNPKTNRREKSGRRKLSDMWARMGAHMLAKCATAIALRKAFPEDLGGLYVSEEMEQAGEAVAGGNTTVTVQPIRDRAAYEARSPVEQEEHALAYKAQERAKREAARDRDLPALEHLQREANDHRNRYKAAETDADRSALRMEFLDWFERRRPYIETWEAGIRGRALRGMDAVRVALGINADDRDYAAALRAAHERIAEIKATERDRISDGLIDEGFEPEREVNDAAQ